MTTHRKPTLPTTHDALVEYWSRRFESATTDADWNRANDMLRILASVTQ
jgi:hypothetical protein